MSAADSSHDVSPTLLDRALRPFAQVRAGEGVIALLMFACVFLLLCGYYLLKTAREGLILSGGMLGLRGDELKIYASGGMALLFAVIIPAYGRLAGRVRRIRLINITYGLVVACALSFFVLGRAGVPIGLAFYVWLGLASMFLVAQFWSYANDIYSEEQGKRLFAIIATGGSAGAIVGPRLTTLADTYALLLVAVAMLLACLALFNLVERMQSARAPAAARTAHAPIAGPGGFALVFRDRYLLAIAAMLLVANLVNSTGEYLLSNVATAHAAARVPDAMFADLGGAAHDAAIAAARREVIKDFYGTFFFWVNLTGFLIQALLVSRIIARVGVRAALFVLPLVALGTYGAIGLVGGAALVRVAKVAENATDYSLQNTVRQALFLPTSRAVKYQGKAAIDTFFVRFGDTASALLVGVGIHRFGVDVRQLALVNVGLVTSWLALAVGVARGHRALDPSAPAPRPVRRRLALAVGVAALVVAATARANPPAFAGDEPTARDVAGAPLPGEETGRVDRPSGDSTARVVARGLLLVPRTTLELMFTPAEGVAWVADRYQVGERARRLFFNEEGTVGMFPVASLQSGFGLSVGGRFVNRDVFGAHEHLDLRAGGHGRYLHHYALSFHSGDRFGEALRVRAGAGYALRGREVFHGLGNGDLGVAMEPRDPMTSALAAEARFQQRTVRATASADVRITSTVHARVGGTYADHEFARSRTAPPIDLVFDTARLPGFGGTQILHGELELQWDTRRRANAWEPRSVPSAGQLIAAYAGRATALDGGADFWRYGGDLQQYLRVGAGPRVIALRGHAEAVSGSLAEVPFNELPRLGGAQRLRGYPLDRFRDRIAVVGSAEYQWDLSRALSASLFADAGRVYRAASDLSLDDLRVGYGVAVEAHSDERFVARVSMASSIDGGVFVDVSLDPVFDIAERGADR